MLIEHTYNKIIIHFPQCLSIEALQAISGNDSNLVVAARLAKRSLPFFRLVAPDKSRKGSLCETVNFIAGC